MINPALYIAMTPDKGRGVFAAAPLEAGLVIEVSPVIVLPSKDRAHLDKTLLHDYIFEWGSHQRRMLHGLRIHSDL